MSNNTTPITNDFLDDEGLSYQEKLTYILVMKYQRFVKGNKSFCSWLNNHGLRGKTYTKYVESLIEKGYIKQIKKNDFYLYAKNRVGEIHNYNDQAFGIYFKSGVSFVPVNENILFDNKLSMKQKLVLIFLEREIKRCQELKGYKINLQTIENDSGMSDIRRTCLDLKTKGVIDYEKKYYSSDPSDVIIINLEINYDSIHYYEVDRNIKTIEPVSSVVQKELPIQELVRIIERQESKPLEIKPLKDEEDDEPQSTWEDYLNGYCSEPPKKKPFEKPWSIWDNVPGHKTEKIIEPTEGFEELLSMI